MMDSFFSESEKTCITIFRKHSEKNALHFHGESEVFIFES